jgi:hypothetical protein
MMNGNKSLKYILSISILISFLVSIVISYTPNLFTYQPVFYSYLTIFVGSSIFIFLLIVFIRRFDVPVEFLVLLLSFYIFITIGFSYNSYSSDLVTVPSVINSTSDNAKILLENDSLIAEVSYQTINSSNPNMVISQDPTNGTLLVKKSKVKIVIGLPESVVSIIDPGNNNYVPQNTTVNGSVQKLQPGDRVYLLIQPQPLSSDGPYRWYIQPTPNQPINVTVKEDGSWESNAYFGSPGDEGRRFLIVAIVTDQKLTETLGFNLPPYKSISNSVYVTRN